MKKEYVQLLAKICSYVADAEKTNYEEYIASGGCADDHIYSLVIKATHILMNEALDAK